MANFPKQGEVSQQRADKSIEVSLTISIWYIIRHILDLHALYVLLSSILDILFANLVSDRVPNGISLLIANFFN